MARDPEPKQGWLTTLIAAASESWRRADRYVRRQLVWNKIYRATSYLKASLWIVPLLAILIVLALAPILRWLDAWIGWRLVGLTTSGAQSLYQSVITLTLSFVVFTFGSLLVAIQVASGQLTPRIIATTLLRDPVVKYSVGLFVFTLVFAVMALNRLEKTAEGLVPFLTASLGIACMASFLFLIDYAARLLRPVSILARVGNGGLEVIKAVYPIPAGDEPDVSSVLPVLGKPGRVVRHRGTSEIVLAVDLDTLVREAQRTGGLIEFVREVGDFVATDEPLFMLYGAAAASDDTRLLTTVAFGVERTMEQDPLFSFRIMVDIGLKALSPAINDPTTAVLALDQIHRLLRVVGQRQLRGEVILDKAGHPRVIYRTPNWEDFVNVSCHEIRMCGAGSVQIARRMRAMLDDLVRSLPPYRRPALEQEARRLTEAIGPLYRQPEDLALASVPDSQGLGGSSAGRASSGSAR
jgi:uncharacterized membrane protein